jgi:hypothetical protein
MNSGDDFEKSKTNTIIRPTKGSSQTINQVENVACSAEKQSSETGLSVQCGSMNSKENKMI